MRLNSTTLSPDLTSPLPIIVYGHSPAGPSCLRLGLYRWDEFGHGLTERFDITPSSTGVALSLPPRSDSLLLSFIPSDGRAVFSPDLIGVTGATVQFRSVGASGTLRVSYQVSDTGWSTDLVKAFPVLDEFATDVYGVRLSGAHATGTLGDWQFSASYPGRLYNSVQLSGTETELLVQAPFLDPIHIQHNGNPETLYRSILGLRSSRLAPIEVVASGGSVPTGTVTLAGGSLHAADAGGFLVALSETLPELPCVVVPLFPVDQSMVDAFVQYCSEAQVDAMLVATPTGTVAGSYPNVVLVEGECVSRDGTSFPAALTAAEIFTFPFMATYVGLSGTVYPAVSASVFTGQGRVAIVSSPGYDLRLSDTISMDGQDHRLDYWLRAVLIRAYSGLIGSNSIPSNLDDSVRSVLVGMPFIRDASIRSAFDRRSGVLFVEASIYSARRVLHVTIPMRLGG